MEPEEWPLEPPSERGDDGPRRAVRGRMATVRADFLLDPESRLTEQERALMTAMLAGLVGTIADEIVAALPSGLAPANDRDALHLSRRLLAQGMLDDSALIALLLRQADEERIGGAARTRPSATVSYLQALIADPDENVSAAAMDLILARARRRDRLGQPRLEFDDLPLSLAGPLANAVAAALRGTISSEAEHSEIDSQLGAAAASVVGRHDPANGIGVMTARLVEALAKADKLDEELLRKAADAGDMAFLAEALATRAGIDGDSAREHLVDGGNGRLALLLRVAGVSRSCSARMLADLGDTLGIADPAAELVRFDQIDEAKAGRERRWLALDPSYRSAARKLHHG